MSQHNRTGLWSQNAIQIVKRNLPKDKYVLSDSSNCTYQTKSSLEDKDLIISYNYFYKVFIVWNTLFHQLAGNTQTLCAGASVTNFLKEHYGDEEFLRNILLSKEKGKGTSYHEYIYIVGENKLLNFCKNYQSYFKDANQLIGLTIEQKELEQQRDKETVERNKRDRKFSESILKLYNYTCIVCGTQEEQVLEAAHIVSVADNGPDTLDNGYCLCANHHRLFDSGLLNINLKQGTFSCSSEKSKEESWYQEAEKRQFHLFLPNDLKI